MSHKTWNQRKTIWQWGNSLIWIRLVTKQNCVKEYFFTTNLQISYYVMIDVYIIVVLCMPKQSPNDHKSLWVHFPLESILRTFCEWKPDLVMQNVIMIKTRAARITCLYFVHIFPNRKAFGSNVHRPICHGTALFTFVHP